MLSIHSSISPKAVAIHSQAGKVGINFTRAATFQKTAPGSIRSIPFPTGVSLAILVSDKSSRKASQPQASMTSIMARPTNWLSYEFSARKEDDNAVGRSGKMLVSRLFPGQPRT
jgi:hypothetical protein